MRTLILAGRTAKEILRDPLTLGFGLGFPLILLLLLSAIQSNIPVNLFEIDSLAPGIAVFGLSFMTMFSATLLARDRETAFLQRLYTTPLRAADYIFGYMLPLLLIAVLQSLICYGVACFLGLAVSVNILAAVAFSIPIALFFISLGLLCGSVMNVKQASGLCGALLVNLSAWLSGIWFDLSLVGGWFRDVAYVLPFAHAVDLERQIICGDFSQISVPLAVIAAYAAVTVTTAVILFLRQMKK